MSGDRVSVKKSASMYSLTFPVLLCQNHNNAFDFNKVGGYFRAPRRQTLLRGGKSDLNARRAARVMVQEPNSS
jgi:hypothetical protein